MSTATLVPHGHVSSDDSAALPSLALAPTRTRTYKARGDASRAIEQRVLQMVADLPVTPTVRQLYYLLVSAALLPKTEQGYTSLKRRLGRMRKGGVLAYDALIDGTCDRKRPLTFSAPSEALAWAASLYRPRAKNCSMRWCAAACSSTMGRTMSGSPLSCRSSAPGPVCLSRCGRPPPCDVGHDDAQAPPIADNVKRGHHGGRPDARVR